MNSVWEIAVCWPSLTHRRISPHKYTVSPLFWVTHDKCFWENWSHFDCWKNHNSAFCVLLDCNQTHVMWLHIVWRISAQLSQIFYWTPSLQFPVQTFALPAQMALSLLRAVQHLLCVLGAKFVNVVTCYINNHKENDFQYFDMYMCSLC